MKLTISILLNLCLSGGLAWVLMQSRQTVPKPAAPADPAPGIVEAAAPAGNSVAETKPFRWGQIEADDYPTYIANLRAIECPEQTIRDIIKADLDGVYSPKRDQLKEKFAGEIMNATAAGSLARSTLDQGLKQLNDEETALLETLLGTRNAETAAGASQPKLRPSRNRPAVMPLAFQNIDPAGLQPAAESVSVAAVIEEVKRKFQAEIGAQDPADPAYRDRWNAAQRKADDRLRGMLGRNVYLELQLRAANRMPSALTPQ